MKKFFVTLIFICYASIIYAQTIGFYRTPCFDLTLKYECIEDTKLVSLDRTTGLYKILDDEIKKVTSNVPAGLALPKEDLDRSIKK